MKALLVGVYFDTKTNDNCLTRFGENCIDKRIIEEFECTIKTLGTLKFEKTRIFFDQIDYPIVAFVGLGDKDASFCKRDDLHLGHENIKKAIATGINAIKKLSNKIDKIMLDDCNCNYELIGLTVGLCSYSYKDYVNLRKEKNADLIFELDYQSPEDKASYERGFLIANFQNISRLLSETPSNLITPVRFSEFAEEMVNKYGIEIIVHNHEWAKEKGMNSFLAVAQGSLKDCKFIELHYKHFECEEQKPIILVGKGITFDSGGLSLKKASRMDLQRADMTGSACVLSTMLGISKLNLKGNFIGLMPLTENMPGSKSMKPGDVVIAMNGKSIQINNTDAEGRLILADALSYADTFNPKIVIDVATLTGAARTALGQCASAVFTTSDELFDRLHEASQITSQRVWRFPLYSDYLKRTSNSVLADMVNQSKDSNFGGSSCIAAAFLSEFTKCANYIHIDIAPTKLVMNDIKYMSKGMSGGPVILLLAFIEKLCL